MVKVIQKVSICTYPVSPILNITWKHAAFPINEPILTYYF